MSFLSNLVIVPLVGLRRNCRHCLDLHFCDSDDSRKSAASSLSSFSISSTGQRFSSKTSDSASQIGAPALLTVLTYYLLLQVVLTIGVRSRHFLVISRDLHRCLECHRLESGRCRTGNRYPNDNSRHFQIDDNLHEEANGETVLINGGGKSQILRQRRISRSTLSAISWNWDHRRNLSDYRAGRAITESLVTIAEALDRRNRSNSAMLGDSFRSLNPAVCFQSDSVSVLFLTEAVAVQSLNSGRRDC